MQQNHLTSGDVCEIAGIQQNTLDYWVNREVIQPVNNAMNGTGRHRTFSTMQAVAVAYGNAWRREGCSLAMIKPIVQFVANMSEAELEKELAAGRTVMMPLSNKAKLTFGLVDVAPMLGPEATRDQRLTLSNLDLDRCYAQVKRHIKKLGERPANVMGRNR